MNDYFIKQIAAAMMVCISCGSDIRSDRIDILKKLEDGQGWMLRYLCGFCNKVHRVRFEPDDPLFDPIRMRVMGERTMAEELALIFDGLVPDSYEKELPFVLARYGWLEESEIFKGEQEPPLETA